jgi:hypothetical protein
MLDTDPRFIAYRLAYETWNKKPLVIDFIGDSFFIEGLPHKLSNMKAMTDCLNERIARRTKPLTD